MRRIVNTNFFQRQRRADIRAFAAAAAFCAIDSFRCFHANRPGLAYQGAVTAMDAFLGRVGDFCLRTDGFRVVAPGTGEGATLQKNRCPDARSVIKGKAMNVGNQGQLCDFHICPVARS